MDKLIVVIMGQDCEDTIDMCLESVKDADKIIYLDGGSKDKTLKIIGDRAEIIKNKFDKSNPDMISIQRNFYLDYLKENYMGEWVLVLDADEVVDNLEPFKKVIEEQNYGTIFSPKMRHFIYTLGFEDATQPTHYVANRFFQVLDYLKYPIGEHCILGIKKEPLVPQNLRDNLLIWHLGYLGGAYDVKKRFDQQLLRNNGHSEKFLKDWNKTHILGRYPVRSVNPDDLPEIILKNFGLSREELYFENRRQLQNKHLVFVKQWNEFLKPKNVADFGCGMGLFLYVWEMVVDCCVGFDISTYAANNKVCNSTIYGNYDLSSLRINYYHDFENNFELVTALDVLEHLEYDGLDNAINNLIRASNKYILTSIPYKDDPNYYLDKTHKICETKDWWRKKFEDKGLKYIEVPENWIFRNQLMIFEK